MRKSLFVLAILMSAIRTVPAAAQETRGAVEGIVKDTTGGVLPGVLVETVQKSTSARSTATTDATGSYRFPSLAPGVYTVTAALSGFNKATADDVTVTVGQLLKINLTLSLASMSISATVTAEAPQIDVKQNSVVATVTAETLDLLPKDRDYLSALGNQPGMNYETNISGSRATGLIVDGASQTENRFVVDGQDTTDLRTGLSGKAVAVDFVEQIQVKQAGYSAEFRATTGGVVSVITKSGTNQYHGDIGADYRGKALNNILGDIRPGLRLCTTCSGNVTYAEYFTAPRTSEYEQYTLEPIVDVGGPIFKSKAWFFAGADPTTTNQDRTVQWPNPGIYPAVQTFNAKNTDNRFLYNGTVQLTTNLRARISGNNQKTSAALSLPGIDTSTFIVIDGKPIATAATSANPATFNPRSQLHTVNWNDSYSVATDWTIDTKTFASISGGYLGTKSHDIGGDYNHSVRRTFSATNIGLLDVPTSLQQANNYADGNSNSFRVKDDYFRWNIGGDVTRYMHFKGQHAVKVGMQYERYANDVDSGAQFPNVALSWNATRTTTDQRSVRGKYGYYTVSQTHTFGNIHSNNMGLFVQDQWGVTPRLTLNLGVRADNTNIPSYREENPGITFGFKDKIAPRLGFAYDVSGNSKWKLFGSTGIFYDIEKLELPRGAWGAEHQVSYYWTLDSYDWPSINCDGTPNSGCPGTFIEQFDARHVSNDVNASLVDPSLKPYKTGEFDLGLDHEMSRSIKMGMRYAHKWVYGDSVIEDVGVRTNGIGDVYYIANPGYGLGAYPLTEAFPRTPIPVRDYDSVEFTFDRRLTRSWGLTSSLVWSRLWGSYTGLSNNSTESNRNAPNVSRMYDGLFMSFTERGCPSITNCDGYANYGLLGTNRPLTYKANFIYRLPWTWTNTSVGANFVAQSGNMQTTQASYKGVPVQIYGTNDLGTSPIYSNTDLLFTQSLTVPWHGLKGTLQFNVSNVFDQDFVTSTFATPSRDTNSLILAGDSCTLCGAPFFAGFNTLATYAALNTANANTARPDPRYGMANGYRGARSARLTLKFRF